MPKLTKALVAAIEPPDAGSETTWDSVLRGFGVRASAGGTKTYVLKYRTRDEARVRWLTIARVGTLTLDEARQEASNALGQVAKGNDPAAEKQASRKAETMAQLVEFYALQGLIVQRGKRGGQPMKPATAKNTIARLRIHVVPLLGSLKAKSVTPSDVERFFRDVKLGKTARTVEVIGTKGQTYRKVIASGGAGAARKVVRDLSAVFTFAVRQGIVSANPVLIAKVPKADEQNTRFLSAEELQRLGAALDELEADGVNLKALNIVRLLALTGARKEEIASLRWSEVDLGAGFFRLQDTKTGRSNRPIGSEAMALLAKLKKTASSNSPWVFPAEKGDASYSGLKRYWPRITAKANLQGVTPHTLRHSLGSIAASSGEALLIVGAMLGHSNARSTSIYAHIAESPAQLAANRASAAVVEAMSGKQPKVYTSRASLAADHV
ncbi:site-specific integrase [Devosia sp. BSSL-BM10]|uniref:Site-specific integrase n=1 Tax=Devosia litorisediminis TaxID=2829817 RepID=A0A942EAT3_9HYPH|nr:site-specific integrase [Devosia litorisediminis]MBS3850487.1 site-specific integrase [Devosia litorisediminis]